MTTQIANIATPAQILEPHEDTMESNPFRLGVLGTLLAILFTVLFAAVVVYDFMTLQIGSPL